MAYRKRTNAYWDKRAQEQLTLVELETLPYLKSVDRAYRESQKSNLDSVKSLYLNYYGKEGFDVTALKQVAPKGDIRRFKEAVEEAGLSSRLPSGYGFRLSRLELLEGQMWLEIHKAALAQNTAQSLAFAKTIDTAYYHSLYTIAKATGISPAFTTIDTKTVNRILNARFAGKNFSERVWSNTGKLAKELNGILAKSVATGESHSKTTRLIRDRYKVKRFEAARLVHTETARFNFDGTQQAYSGIGIDRWVYVATLDSRTDDTCGSYDGKIYPVGDGPDIPIHTSCRCCARPYIGKYYEPDERIMRNTKTGKNSYVGNISYDQWRDIYL